MPAIEPPAPRSSAHARFDEAAIERLEALLNQECLSSGGLPLEVVDGLFSCAWVSPGAPLTLDDLMPVVLGDAAGSASEELLRLLELMWDAIGRRIAQGPAGDPRDALPLIGVPPELDDMEEGDPLADEFLVGSGWALGFLLAFNLRAPEWDLRLDEDEELAWDVMDIFALMPPLSDDEDDEDDAQDEADDDAFEDEDDVSSDPDEADYEEFADEEDEPASFEDRMAIIGTLPEILHDLHQLAIHERTPRTPARREEAPARNDPCPCGSGKKFKKCHGDPSRLN